jgi:hypothetical protein
MTPKLIFVLGVAAALASAFGKAGHILGFSGGW